jgi:hypothetical protein
MEDLWGILIVAGIIIFKAIEAKGRKSSGQELTEPEVILPEEILTPEESKRNSRKTKPTAEQNATRKKPQRQQQAKPVAEQPDAGQNATTPTADTDTDDAAISINPEEVRQGIIWSEILNRKY